mgnify:CR=1 FL=1
MELLYSSELIQVENKLLINNKMQTTFNLIKPDVTPEDDYTVFIKEEDVLKPMLAFIKEGNKLIPIKVLL